jgi:hypothetical protein
LSAVAVVSFWNIYFNLVPGAVRVTEMVAFLKPLRRHLANSKLLIVWIGYQRTAVGWCATM